MTAPRSVVDLVDRFHNNLDAYKHGIYNETQVRREFIDPLFTELGWDVDNKQGYAEAYKDVVHEDQIKVGDALQAPDYCFRIGGTRKFFLEAKKPSVYIKEEVPPAYQLRRYAWSAKLPLSILTDFEEFAVYDCRIKPASSDKPSVARTKYLKYTDYVDQWDTVAEIFHRDAILKGSFDKYAESNARKKGTTEVDSAFLAEIEGWRDSLARNIALRNPDIEQRELNDAVQRTIDRIIFLRICEDRGIEKYGRLKELVKTKGVYKDLTKLFVEADSRYNSGLFHFSKEKGREDFDNWTLNLKIDDNVLAEVLRKLYYPDSPYEFSVLPADILGQVYEQFLGKVIRLTKGHQAKVEEKPEVRKAGGVYYTPTYIVDYIVQNTLGKLLEGKTPKDIKGDTRAPVINNPQSVNNPQSAVKKSAIRNPQSAIRVLDPACGSGSFLLVAYQFLLDWYLKQYIAEGPETHAKGKSPVLYQGKGGDYFLTATERKRILLAHIYGVDIDAQAVEVTKLSLLLKVLEGENAETMGKNLALFHERALPDLHNNIKCGNSLIGPDFFHGKQMDALEPEEIYRINAFDWKSEFKEVFGAKDEDERGFDVVIGNPPYIRIQTMKESAPIEVDLYKEKYKSASTGNYDIYVVFVERGLSLINKHGKMGFILPHKFFTAQYGEPIRTQIVSTRCIESIVHFGHEQVFAGATTYTCLLFLSQNPQKHFAYYSVKDLSQFMHGDRPKPTEQTFESIASGIWSLRTSNVNEIMEKVTRKATPLGQLCERIAQGIRTSYNEIYVVDIIRKGRGGVVARSKHLDSEIKLEDGLLSEFLQGREIKRYQLLSSNKAVIIPYRLHEGRSVLIPETELGSKYPLTYKYFSDNRKVLEMREHGKMQGDAWYGFVYPKNIEIMKQMKLIAPDIAAGGTFALDSDGRYAFTSGYGLILKEPFAGNYLPIAAILNSKLLTFCLFQMSTVMRGGYVRLLTQYLEHLPVLGMDTADSRSSKILPKIRNAAEGLVSLFERQPVAKTDHDKKLVQRQIESTDAEIDRLVYELYDLTDDEIRIVEESARTKS